MPRDPRTDPLPGTEEQRFRAEYELHMSTWGPHCGAPYAVYEGHLKVLLAAHRRMVEAENMPAERPE